MITIRNNLPEVIRRLALLQGDMPDVAKDTINTTAFRLKDKTLPKAMEKDLKRPLPVTKKGGLVKKATNQRLKATLFFKPFVEKYIRRTIVGFNLQGKAVPLRLRVDQAGNIRKLWRGTRIKALTADPRVFHKKIGRTFAIWRAKKRCPKSAGPKKRGCVTPLIGFNIAKQVPPKFKFQQRMEAAARRLIPRIAEREIRRTLRKRGVL